MPADSITTTISTPTAAFAALVRAALATPQTVPASRRAGALASPGTPSAADTALRAQVLARLANDAGWNRDYANAHVVDGTVILQGLYARQADRRSVRAAVLAIPGVRRLRDDRTRLREWQAMA